MESGEDIADFGISLRSLGLGNAEHQLRKSAYDQLSLTVERLNESLGMCLK